MDKKILKLTDVNGIEKEYEILMFFKWFKTNRNYIIYTDNTYNEDNVINLYDAEVINDEGQFILQDVVDYENIDLITKEIDRIISTK